MDAGLLFFTDFALIFSCSQFLVIIWMKPFWRNKHRKLGCIWMCFHLLISSVRLLKLLFMNVVFDLSKNFVHWTNRMRHGRNTRKFFSLQFFLFCTYDPLIVPFPSNIGYILWHVVTVALVNNVVFLSKDLWLHNERWVIGKDIGNNW